MARNDEFVATVAILTYNGEDYLRRILESVTVQRVEGAVEVLVIDSGSTDSTLDILADFPEVRLHTIPNEEFGHGRTRNLAARLARGDYIAYLTHDAVPIGDRWLAHLLEPFELDDRIVAVLGNQVPRPRCFPLLKYEILGLFARFGSPVGISVFQAPPVGAAQSEFDEAAFYSDVNSAARTDFLRERIPYRDVRYAEDQLFGADVIAAGYRKAFAARARVEHSNDLTRAEYGKRIFDETVGLREIGHGIPVLRRRAAFRLIARGVLGDSLRILRDADFGWRRRLYWLAVNPLYHVTKWTAYRRATLVDLADSAAIAAGSLESSRKSTPERG